MKRYKRDLSKRAFYKGYLAASQNKAADMCPYEHTAVHQVWINGWREGREDYWRGYRGPAIAQKLEICCKSPR